MMRNSKTSMRRTGWVAIAAVTLLLSPAAHAGGYIVGEVDSEAAGRGGAAAGLVDTPAAVFFNPAALTNLDGLNVRLGMSFIIPSFAYEPPGGGAATTTLGTVSTPPNFALSYKIGDLGFGEIAAGLGFSVPYGASFSWPDGWEGRGEIEQIGLTVYEISPVIAVRPSEMFSVGIGLRILPGQVYMRRALRFGSEAEGDIEMAGSGTEAAMTAGISIWGFENLTIGLSWRSPVVMRMSGESDVELPPPFDTQAEDRPVGARIRLPQVLRFGIAYDILPDTLNVSADIEMQQWSELRKIPINFINADGSKDRRPLIRDAQDSITLHVGAEYKIMEGLEIRMGYVFDEHSIPEETLGPAPPDSDRHVLAFGASYTWDKWLGFHAHFSNVFFTPRETNLAPLQGTYSGGHGGDTVAFIFGFGISAHFDVGPVVDEPLFNFGELGLEQPKPAADAAAPPAAAPESPAPEGEGGEAAADDAAPAPQLAPASDEMAPVDEETPAPETAPPATAPAVEPSAADAAAPAAEAAPTTPEGE